MRVFLLLPVPIYFKQTQYKSFQRQLSLYGFRRLSYGLDSGAYYHTAFMRGRHSQCSKVSRKGGLDSLKPSSGVTQDEPNFYTHKWAPPVDKCNIWQYLKNHQREDPHLVKKTKDEGSNNLIVTVANQPPLFQPSGTLANVDLDVIEPIAFDEKVDPVLSWDLPLVSDDSENGGYVGVGSNASKSQSRRSESDEVAQGVSANIFAANNWQKTTPITSHLFPPVDSDVFEGLGVHAIEQGQVFDQRLHEPISEDFFVTVLP